MRRGHRVFLAAALLLAAPAAAEPRLTADPDLAKSDAALLRDAAKAASEFQRRMRDQITFRNGLLIVQDRTSGSSGLLVMPATAMWSIDCGDGGISLTLGSGSGDTDNGTSLQLTSAAVSDERCRTIAPALGEAMMEIAKGN